MSVQGSTHSRQSSVVSPASPAGSSFHGSQRSHTEGADMPQSVFFQYPHCGGTVPPARWAHSAAAVGSKLFVYGGVGSAVFDDLHILDTEIMVWRSATTSVIRAKERPGKRMCQATAVVGDIMWLFGGQQGRKYVRDLFSLNTENLQWQQHNCNSLPSARAGHSMTAADNVIYLFGGQGKKFLSDLHLFKTETMEWQELQPSGKAPCARRGHSLVWNGKDSLILFGGSSSSSMDNTVFVYAISDNKWITPTVHGTPPPARTQHTASLISPTQLLVFGGCNSQGVFFNDVHILDITTLTWQRPQLIGTALAPRYHHSCCLMNGKLLLYGGINSKQTFDGVVVLETSFNQDISHVAEELFKISNRTGEASASTPEPIQDLMKVQLRDLLLKRNMEEARIQAAHKAQQAQEQLGRTREEKDGLAAEVSQLKLMLVESEEVRRQLASRCADLEARLQRAAAATEAAELALEHAREEAGATATQLQAALVARQNMERELGLLASRYSRTTQERDALLADKAEWRSAQRRERERAEGTQHMSLTGEGSSRMGEGAERGEGEGSQHDGGAGEPSSIAGGQASSGQHQGDSSRGDSGSEARGGAQVPGTAGDGHGASGDATTATGSGAQALGDGRSSPEARAGVQVDAVSTSFAPAVSRAADTDGASAAYRAQVAELMLRRMQGEPAALESCSLSELQQLVDVLEKACRAVREEVVVRRVAEFQLQAVSDVALCSLCMEHPRGVVFNCGHQTCEACSVKINVCPFCRSRITAKIRMFDT